jgi:hypothetical protein
MDNVVSINNRNYIIHSIKDGVLSAHHVFYKTTVK